MSADADGENVFDLARESAQEYSQRLGENPNIDVISFNGPIGSQAIIAEGADLDYQAQYAVMAALEEQLQRELFVDDLDHPSDAHHEIDRALSRLGLDPFQAEAIADDAVAKLEDWQDYHEGDAGEVGE